MVTGVLGDAFSEALPCLCFSHGDILGKEPPLRISMRNLRANAAPLANNYLGDVSADIQKPVPGAPRLGGIVSKLEGADCRH